MRPEIRSTINRHRNLVGISETNRGLALNKSTTSATTTTVKDDWPSGLGCPAFSTFQMFNSPQMDRRQSTSIRLEDDAVDQNGVARFADDWGMPPTDDATIAPWIDYPVSVIMFNFQSLSSFVVIAHSSTKAYPIAFVWFCAKNLFGLHCISASEQYI